MDGRPKSKLPSTKRAEIVDGRVKKDVAVLIVQLLYQASFFTLGSDPDVVSHFSIEMTDIPRPLHNSPLDLLPQAHYEYY